MNTLLSGERERTNLAEKVGNLPNFVQNLNIGQTPRQLEYNSYLLSSEWRLLRRRIIIRSKGICEHCGVASVEEVHHLTYKRFKRELLSDLLGLCSECHRKIHNIKNNHLIPLVFGGD